VKRGDRIGALILIKTANMATTHTEEVANPGELEETARGTGGFGSTGIAKLKRHNHGGGKPCGAKKVKRESSTESEEDSEYEESEFEESMTDTESE